MNVQNWHGFIGVCGAFAMRTLGLTLLFFGLGPIVAEYFGREFEAFAWIDTWGLEVSLIIKTALITFGAALFLPGKRGRQQRQRQVPSWTPNRPETPYPDPVAGLYNRPHNRPRP